VEPFHSSFLELSDSISCLIGRMKPLYFLFGYEMILIPFDTVKMSTHMSVHILVRPTWFMNRSREIQPIF
jgi:hypothetical protein